MSVALVAPILVGLCFKLAPVYPKFSFVVRFLLTADGQAVRGLTEEGQAGVRDLPRAADGAGVGGALQRRAHHPHQPGGDGRLLPGGQPGHLRDMQGQHGPGQAYLRQPQQDHRPGKAGQGAKPKEGQRALSGGGVSVGETCPTDSQHIQQISRKVFFVRFGNSA